MKHDRFAVSAAAFVLLSFAASACTQAAEPSASPAAAPTDGSATDGGGAPPPPLTEATANDGGAPGTGNGSCTGAACPAPSATDNVKNGDETDVDCGGANAPKCATAKTCRAHGDCASDGCAYDGKCVAARSCTQHAGGDTCGVGEVGDPDAKHVSCCESAPLFGDLQSVQLDRFLVTAGRMRAFIERTSGNVRGFVHTLPANKWQPDWDEALVPSTIDEANQQLGSFFDKKSCHPGDHTGHTYATPPTPDDASDFSKDELDAKALNCVTWQLVAAFCAWDGGRMPTSAELQNAFTEGGKYVQPWLWQPGAQQYVPQADEFSEPAPPTSIFNHAFAYGFPAEAAPGRDAAYYVSPPGRFPTSWNEHGHEIAGNLLTWNASGPFVFTRNYSWENHGGDDVADSSWKEFEAADVNEPNGYYAIGGRCARDP